MRSNEKASKRVQVAGPSVRDLAERLDGKLKRLESSASDMQLLYAKVCTREKKMMNKKTLLLPYVKGK